MLFQVCSAVLYLLLLCIFSGSHWNVDAAYRQFKAANMAKSGFQQPKPVPMGQYAPQHNFRASQPAPVSIPIAFAKPTSFRIEDGLGMAMSGMGPAVGSNNPFHPPQHLPKFPVDPGREHVIPVQVNT